MPEITIVYWRDIPAQVLVGRGRRGGKAPLAERFEQAIDRAAMKVGASDTDAYLAEWRRASGGEGDGEPQALAEATAASLELEYDDARLRALIANDGWAGGPSDP
ncbi:virulence factor [Salipiger bermudensis]|uniref:virulence factor n=1 Tax=Salipiger bermudensis TaxID=344736 RepID=UPI001C99B4D3|nr:virulence factor [Salipiger bermudensis]MBY6005981.1 virulence factor [Salipiger bermudensis]